jgi:3-oxoacyl-[acyl-carrier protein] reductase
MEDLAGKVALVTGGTRGIGREIASLFASLGARVVLTGTRPEVAERVACEVATAAAAAGSAEVAGFGLDVASDDAVAQVVDATLARFGRLDVLVNNAGVARDNLVLRMSSEDWDQVLTVNLGGVFRCTKRAVKHMLRQRSGAIVSVSSIVGLAGNPGQANYAASKAGIVGFTLSVAREYAARGIRANVVAPGFIETDMTSAIPEEKRSELVGRIPLGRLGTPRDVARVVAFLASDLAGYVTGQVVRVDGGMAM